MSPATAQQIQAAVRRFLDGGSAQEIYNLAGDDYTKKLLVESAGVVDKLVDLLVHDKPAGEGRQALFALYYCVQIGQVAQDAIAHAHDGAIFKWLAGPQDHGRADAKNTLITNFTNNHPTNTLLLDAVRGGVAPLVELAFKSLQGLDHANAALAMNLLDAFLRKQGAAFPVCDSSFATLVSVLDWRSANNDSQLLAIRDHALSILTQVISAEKSQRDLPHTPLDQLKILTSASGDARSKLLAVSRLRQTALDDGLLPLTVASGGGIRALVAAADAIDDGAILTKALQTLAADLLGVLAQGVTSIPGQEHQQSSLLKLLQPCESEAQPHVAAALNVFRGIVGDEGDVNTIARSCGIPFIFELLRFVKTYRSTQESAVVRILFAILFGADNTMNEDNQRAFMRCDGAVQFLVELLDSTTADSSDELRDLTSKLGWVVLELIARVQDGQADGIDNTATVLKVLELLSICNV